MLDKTFEPRQLKLSDTIKQEQSYKNVEIVMRIDSSAEYRVMDEFSDSDIKQNDDKSFEVKMKCIEDNWIYGYILSFRSSAKVISPPELRETIKDIIGEMASNYSKEIE